MNANLECFACRFFNIHLNMGKIQIPFYSISDEIISTQTVDISSFLVHTVTKCWTGTNHKPKLQSRCNGCNDKSSCSTHILHFFHNPHVGSVHPKLPFPILWTLSTTRASSTMCGSHIQWVGSRECNEWNLDPLNIFTCHSDSDMHHKLAAVILKQGALGAHIFAKMSWFLH